MNIRIESPDQADVIALIAELDAYQDSLYPAESRYALDLTSLMQPNVVFGVARDAAGAAVGRAAIVLQKDYGELKRMYVSVGQRGNGIAGNLLTHLEGAALARGCSVFRLETGPFQPEALAFYARNGYQRCGRFGDYREDPLSVFMEKHA